MFCLGLIHDEWKNNEASIEWNNVSPICCQGTMRLPQNNQFLFTFFESTLDNFGEGYPVESQNTSRKTSKFSFQFDCRLSSIHSIQSEWSKRKKVITSSVCEVFSDLTIKTDQVEINYYSDQPCSLYSKFQQLSSVTCTDLPLDPFIDECVIIQAYERDLLMVSLFSLYSSKSNHSMAAAYLFKCATPVDGTFVSSLRRGILLAKAPRVFCSLVHIVIQISQFIHHSPEFL